jgi:hypothetical protein
MSDYIEFTYLNQELKWDPSASGPGTISFLGQQASAHVQNNIFYAANIDNNNIATSQSLDLQLYLTNLTSSDLCQL